jgi:hypothetical protein
VFQVDPIFFTTKKNREAFLFKRIILPFGGSQNPTIIRNGVQPTIYLLLENRRNCNFSSVGYQDELFAEIGVWRNDASHNVHFNAPNAAWCSPSHINGTPFFFRSFNTAATSSRPGIKQA